jgi:hypothetical protein
MRTQSIDARLRRAFSGVVQHATCGAVQGKFFTASIAVILAGAVTAASAQAPVSDPAKLSARLDQLERSLSGSSLVQMHQTAVGQFTGANASDIANPGARSAGAAR